MEPDMRNVSFEIDMRITPDLYDGVQVNYAKLGDFVAKYRAITGGADE